MRVLVLAPHAFYVDRGTPIDVDILVRALSSRGDSVDLLCYQQGQDRHYPNLTIHRAPMPKWLRVDRPGFSAAKLLADCYMWRRARQLMREHRYDVIHAGEEAAFMAMRLQRRFNVPYIYDMDSSIAQQRV